MPTPANLATAYTATLDRLTGHLTAALLAIWADLPGYDDTAADQFHGLAVPIVSDFATAAGVATTDYLATVLAFPVQPAPDLFVADAAARCYDPFDRLGRLLSDGTPFDDAVQGARSVVEALGSDTVHRTARSAMGAAQVPLGVRWQRRLASKCCPWCMKLSAVTFDTAGQATFGHANCRCVAVPHDDGIAGHNATIRQAEGFDPEAERLYDKRHARKRLRDSERTARRRSAQAAQEATIEPDPLRRDRLETRAQEWETRAEAAAERLRIMETGTHRLPGQQAA